MLLKENSGILYSSASLFLFCRIAGKTAAALRNSARLPHRAVQANGSQIELFLLDAIFIKVFENLSGKPPPHFGGLYGVYVVERERKYLEAGLFSSSGGLVGRVRSRA